MVKYDQERDTTNGEIVDIPLQSSLALVEFNLSLKHYYSDTYIRIDTDDCDGGRREEECDKQVDATTESMEQ